MTRPDLAFDHVVIACQELSSGVDFIQRQIGVAIPLGGQHHFMGTHNAVMAVGEGIYLEVIAIDPDLPPPSRPRWFGLDDSEVQSRLSQSPICVHYVLRTPDLAATLNAMPDDLRRQLGPVHAASRMDLSWSITIPDDGLPAQGGCLPALIEWQGTPPQYNMARPGPELVNLHLEHPDPDNLIKSLEQMGAGILLDGGLISAASSSPPSHQPALNFAFRHEGESLVIPSP